jgi:hypothetical protein
VIQQLADQTDGIDLVVVAARIEAQQLVPEVRHPRRVGRQVTADRLRANRLVASVGNCQR